MTHPFPLSNQREVMKALDVRCGIGIAHNGIIRLISEMAGWRTPLGDAQITHMSVILL